MRNRKTFLETSQSLSMRKVTGLSQWGQHRLPHIAFQYFTKENPYIQMKYFIPQNKFWNIKWLFWWLEENFLPISDLIQYINSGKAFSQESNKRRQVAATGQWLWIGNHAQTRTSIPLPFPLNPFWYLLQSRETGSRLFHPLLEHQSHVQNTFTSAEIAAVKAHNTSQCPTTGLQGHYPIIPSLMSSGESQVSQKWKFTATPPIFKAKPFVWT